jgi:hypothetical protein
MDVAVPDRVPVKWQPVLWAWSLRTIVFPEVDSASVPARALSIREKFALSRPPHVLSSAPPWAALKPLLVLSDRV